MDNIRQQIDENGYIFYHLADFADVVNLNHHYQRIAQNFKHGRIKRAKDLNCLNVHPDAMFIDGLRMYWICTHSLFENNEMVQTIIKKLQELIADELSAFEPVYAEKKDRFMLLTMANGDKWLKAKDVVLQLGYSKSNLQEIIRKIDDKYRSTWQDLISDNVYLTQNVPSMHPETVFINQAGFDLLALQSNKPEAKKFQNLLYTQIFPQLIQYKFCALDEEQHATFKTIDVTGAYASTSTKADLNALGRSLKEYGSEEGQRIHDQVLKLQSELEKANQTIDEMKREKNAVDTIIDETKRQMVVVQQEKIDMDRAMQEMKQQMSVTQREKEAMERTIDEMKQQMTVTLQVKEVLERVIQETKQQMTELNNQHDQQKDLIRELEQSVKNKNQLINSLHRCKDEQDRELEHKSRKIRKMDERHEDSKTVYKTIVKKYNKRVVPEPKDVQKQEFITVFMEDNAGRRVRFHNCQKRGLNSKSVRATRIHFHQVYQKYVASSKETFEELQRKVKTLYPISFTFFGKPCTFTARSKEKIVDICNYYFNEFQQNVFFQPWLMLNADNVDEAVEKHYVSDMDKVKNVIIKLIKEIKNEGAPTTLPQKEIESDEVTSSIQ